MFFKNLQIIATLLLHLYVSYVLNLYSRFALIELGSEVSVRLVTDKLPQL